MAREIEEDVLEIRLLLDRRLREAAAEVLGEGARLKLHADPALHARWVGEDVDPRDRRGASVGATKALEDLDGGGLPRPVGAEHSEDLALLDAEADPAHRFDVAVALAEVL